jgi:hypothetical protein
LFVLFFLTHYLFLGSWSFHSRVDREKEGGLASTSNDADQSNAAKARELFRNKTVRGQDVKNESDNLKTKHERAISCLCNASASSAKGITHVSSSGLDGKLIVWNLPSIETNFANLGI